MRGRVTCALLVTAAATLAAGAQRNRHTLIAGSRFEASGVVGVPHTNGFCSSTMENDYRSSRRRVDPERGQQSPAEAVSLGVEITDPEDIETDGVMFYVVGSQSRRTERGIDLIRFAYEPSTGRLTKVATLRGSVNCYSVSFSSSALRPQHTRVSTSRGSPEIRTRELCCSGFARPS